MFVTASIPQYRIKEFTQFIRNTLLIVNQHNPAELKVKAQYQELSEICQQLERAYQLTDNSQLSQQLTTLDERRDRAIICLRTLSEGYTRHHKKAQRDAGEQLLECIDTYGSRLYALNYSAETATLKQLLSELQTRPEYQQAVETLQITDVVNEMKQANQAFEKLFVQRLEESIQSVRISNRELMRGATEVYRQLLKHLEAHAILTPSDKYALLVDHLNENIEHFNELIARRKSSPVPELPTVSDTEEATTE